MAPLIDPPMEPDTGVKVPVMNMLQHAAKEEEREKQGRTGAGAKWKTVSGLGSRFSLSRQGFWRMSGTIR